MKLRVKYLAGLALLTAVTVQAQPPPPAPISGPEMVTRVAALKAQIDADAKHMSHLQAVARKEKDVIKLTCVNDTLVQLKAEQNLFDESEQQFTSDMGTEASAARDDFDSMTSTASNITTLRATAEACVGVPELYKQESAASVQHPDLDDPALEDPFSPGIEPPAYASPYN